MQCFKSAKRIGLHLEAEVAASSLKDAIAVVGTVNDTDTLTVNGLSLDRAELQQAWTEVSHQIQRLRDNVETADQEYALIADKSHAGLIAKPTFDSERANRSTVHQ